MLIAPLTYSIK